MIFVTGSVLVWHVCQALQLEAGWIASFRPHELWKQVDLISLNVLLKEPFLIYIFMLCWNIYIHALTFCSCYANAVLQCLTYTPPLNAYLLQGLHSKACKLLCYCNTLPFKSDCKNNSKGSDSAEGLVEIMVFKQQIKPNMYIKQNLNKVIDSFKQYLNNFKETCIFHHYVYGTTCQLLYDDPLPFWLFNLQRPSTFLWYFIHNAAKAVYLSTLLLTKAPYMVT